MKIRQGFVSNSSSSSFIIKKKKLSPLQLHAIQNHIQFNNILKETGMDLEEAYPEEAWSIYEEEQTIEGSCHMDNFDMYSFFKALGISREDVSWDW